MKARNVEAYTTSWSSWGKLGLLFLLETDPMAEVCESNVQGVTGW
jgi:hypothetical protein